jgi:hypothetical protein
MKTLCGLILALATLPVHAQILAPILYHQTAAASQVAPLAFSPVAGTYSSTQTVTISTATSLAVICYTTDGTTPTETANLCLGGTTSTYSTPISVATTQTVQAIGTKALYTDSAVGSAPYTIASLYAKTVTVGSGSGCGGTCTYSSLQAAITGEVSANANLTTLGGILEIKLYSINDTTAATVTGFSGTDATHYVLIHPDSSAQATTGVWDATKYCLTVTAAGNNTGALTLTTPYTQVRNIQCSGSAGSNSGTYCIAVNGVGTLAFGNIVQFTDDTYRNISGIRTTITGGSVYIVNNVIYYTSTGTGESGLGLISTGSGGIVYAYNNTIIAPIGIYPPPYRTAVLKNNIVSGTVGIQVIASAGYTGSGYNSATASTWGSPYAGYTGDRLSQTFTFTNAGSRDYSLAGGDTGALGLGENLSSDANYPFSTNITGSTRTGSWNIGAF